MLLWFLGAIVLACLAFGAPFLAFGALLERLLQATEPIDPHDTD